MLKRVWGADRGATAVEYGLIAAVISVAIIGGVTATGQNVGTTYCRVATALGANAGCAAVDPGNGGGGSGNGGVDNGGGQTGGGGSNGGVDNGGGGTNGDVIVSPLAPGLDPTAPNFGDQYMDLLGPWSLSNTYFDGFATISNYTNAQGMNRFEVVSSGSRSIEITKPNGAVQDKVYTATIYPGMAVHEFGFQYDQSGRYTQSAFLYTSANGQGANTVSSYRIVRNEYSGTVDSTYGYPRHEISRQTSTYLGNDGNPNGQVADQTFGPGVTYWSR